MRTKKPDELWIFSILIGDILFQQIFCRVRYSVNTAVKTNTAHKNITRSKANITEKTTCFCKSFFLVPVTGLEPVRCCHRGILSPLRLPIPPHRRAYAPLCGVLCNYNIIVHTCQAFFTIGIRESNRFIGGAICFFNSTRPRAPRCALLLRRTAQKSFQAKRNLRFS